MSRSLRQLRALLVVALRADSRSRDPLGGRISQSSWGLVSGLVFYLLVGGCLALFMAERVPPRIQIATYFAVAAIYVAFNILIEYQHILLAPEDGDVLHWRPVSSRTLLAARCLHVLAYVSLLSAALLLIPALVVAQGAPQQRAFVLAAFAAAAFLNTVLATGVSVGVYTLMLRATPSRHFRNALAAVQVVMSLSLILGYQLVGPVFERVDARRLLQPPLWFEFLPATWFANIPLGAGGWGSEAPLWPTAVGMLAVLGLGGLAARWIGSGYTTRVASLESTAVTSPSGSMHEPHLQRWFARLFVRHPLKHAGFRFFLSNLSGDRRLYAAVVQVVALPMLLVGMGVLFGETEDPYRTSTTTSGSALALFAAAYLLAMMVPTTSRLLRSSTSWRAAWVVFTSPTRHYDRFYSGLLLGVVYGLVLPTTALLVTVLLLLWRNPVHVLAHLALPTGTALLAFPILLSLDVQVPFSHAPARHERTRELLRVVTTLVPIGVIAYTHSALRARPLVLIASGTLLCVLGASTWPLLARRVRLLPHQRAFDG